MAVSPRVPAVNSPLLLDLHPPTPAAPIHATGRLVWVAEVPFTEQRDIEVQLDELTQPFPAAPDDRPAARAPLTASTSAVPPARSRSRADGEDPSTAPQCEIQRSGSSTAWTTPLGSSLACRAMRSGPSQVGGRWWAVRTPRSQTGAAVRSSPFSTRRPGPAVREVYLAGPRAPRARARHGRRASGRCRRTKAARPGTGGARTGMRSARPATLPQGAP